MDDLFAVRDEIAGAIAEALLGELFSRAIEMDSLYAAAFAGLADSWALMPQFVPSVDAGDAAADARRAAALDPLSPAIASDLGYILLWGGDLEGGRAAFEKA